MASILVPIADGSEELEAVTLIDLFRRAGFDVVVAGLEPGPVRCARGTVLVPDTTLEQAAAAHYDLIVVPGGQPGTDNLDGSPALKDLLQRQHAAGRLVAAICAAPKILANAGLLKGRRATAYPGTLESLQLADTQLSAAAVEVDGKVVTSRGPGTAMDFALTLIELIAGPDKRRQVEAPLQRP